MRIPRFYVPATYTKGQTLPLSKELAHYALTVLRLKHQRPVEVFDGQGNQARAILNVTSRRSADLMIESVSSPTTESPLNTILLQAISKGDRMDYTIQKTVELGISQIQPLFSEHCDVKLSGDKLDKKIKQWRDIAINACEQSGRNLVPEILPATTLEDWFNDQTDPEELTGFVLDPEAEKSLKNLPSPPADLWQQKLHLLIGPEGGLSDNEVRLAVDKGFTAIRLGPRVLRTETAGVTVLSALQCIAGDF